MEAHATLPARTRRWLAEHAGIPENAAIRPLAGGNANAAYEVSWGSERVLLRTPPAGHVDATAHDLAREHRVLTALAGAGVRVPRPHALCLDTDVPHAPLLVLSFVAGTAITDELPAGYPAPSAALPTIGRELVGALAEIHTVDPGAAGLDGFGRPEGFLARQVERWMAQYERNRRREVPGFSRVARLLDERLPRDGDITVLHGDYHLDNSLFAPDHPRLLAVIDWEMATLGDPLLDLGLVLALWGDQRPDPCAFPRIQGVSRLPGAPDRASLAGWYERARGRPLPDIEAYLGLSLFKLAAVVEGAYALYLEGQMDNDYARSLEQDVPRLLSQAESHLRGRGGTV